MKITIEPETEEERNAIGTEQLEWIGISEFGIAGNGLIGSVLHSHGPYHVVLGKLAELATQILARNVLDTMVQAAQEKMQNDTKSNGND